MRALVTAVEWSHVGDDDCIRIVGATPGADVRVRVPPAHMVGELPPMAGRLVADGDDQCFVPRFPFIAGTTYTVMLDGTAAAELVRPRPDRSPTAEVVEIHPTVAEVPRNLLRVHVVFSAPMREGAAGAHVRLVDASGAPMSGALLPMEPELWDGSRRRLTVLLDPARIKRGLGGHRNLGYPLHAGETFRVVVDAGFPDAHGAPLRTGRDRAFAVGPDERRRVDPTSWRLTEPVAHTVAPLELAFDRPLDHQLLEWCLSVVGARGRAVGGVTRVGPDDRSWRFVPRTPWEPGAYRMVVNPVLEDLAGNSVDRVFDRDLARAEDDPRAPGPTAVPFRAELT